MLRARILFPTALFLVALALSSQLPDLKTGARKGYCHCGCSSVRTCKTSDDCGGASCDPFPSCC